MNRTMTSTLGTATVTAAVVAAAVIASGNAFADDITIDTTPVASSASRAQPRSDLLKRSDLPKYDEWSLQSNQVTQLKSAYTPAQARAQYTATRDEVRALNAEDSGSTYFRKMPGGATSVMGGPAR